MKYIIAFALFACIGIASPAKAQSDVWAKLHQSKAAQGEGFICHVGEEHGFCIQVCTEFDEVGPPKHLCIEPYVVMLQEDNGGPGYRERFVYQLSSDATPKKVWDSETGEKRQNPLSPRELKDARREQQEKVSGQERCRDLDGKDKPLCI